MSARSSAKNKAPSNASEFKEALSPGLRIDTLTSSSRVASLSIAGVARDKVMPLASPRTPRVQYVVTDQSESALTSPRMMSSSRPGTMPGTRNTSIAGSNYTSFSTAARKLDRKCPDEEFFTMTLLSLKMKNKTYPAVLSLKASDLYAKAIRE